jgi:hypothetical protein
MLRRLIRRRLIPRRGITASGRDARAWLHRGVAGCGALVVLGAGGFTGMMQPPGGGGNSISAAAAARDAGSFKQIILPDLLIVSPSGLTDAQLARLGQVSGVRNLVSFDGAEIKAGTQPVSVIGVDPAQFRSWVPLKTASNQAFWNALAGGQFVASQSARSQLGLTIGHRYPLTGATTRTVAFGASATLGIDGVDLLVNTQVSRELGLVHRVAALISAPGASLKTLEAAVGRVLGPSGKIVSLRQQQLPVTKATSGQTPTTYLQLFQDSAAQYCPGLSWTVLAAIGQIESGDGANVGPSPAGALGPMQFEPSTWAVWGTDGFGQTGTPDIMNPYDAVPSAARMLCADGAAAGGSSLRSAIFDYNHADWYVNEVLALAAKYAQDYS